jgi:hypothetical protein
MVEKRHYLEDTCASSVGGFFSIFKRWEDALSRISLLEPACTWQQPKNSSSTNQKQFSKDL